MRKTGKNLVLLWLDHTPSSGVYLVLFNAEGTPFILGIYIKQSLSLPALLWAALILTAMAFIWWLMMHLYHRGCFNRCRPGYKSEDLSPSQPDNSIVSGNYIRC